MIKIKLIATGFNDIAQEIELIAKDCNYTIDELEFILINDPTKFTMIIDDLIDGNYGEVFEEMIETISEISEIPEEEIASEFNSDNYKIDLSTVELGYK